MSASSVKTIVTDAGSHPCTAATVELLNENSLLHAHCVMAVLRTDPELPNKPGYAKKRTSLAS